MRNLDEDVKAVFDAINGPSGVFERKLREQFREQHPTLQQAFFRHVIRPVLEEMTKEVFPDDRNRQAKLFADVAFEATKNVSLPTI